MEIRGTKPGNKIRNKIKVYERQQMMIEWKQRFERRDARGGDMIKEIGKR